MIEQFKCSGVRYFVVEKVTVSNLHIVPVTLKKVTCTKCALIPHDARNVAVFFIMF